MEKEFTCLVENNDFNYEIQVSGFRDPVNETIIIENLGETPIVNPRITVNGRYDWFDVETMAKEATRGCKTDEEKVFAIFNFVRTNSHHYPPPGDDYALNPVVFLNIYGNANCAYHAAAPVAMARALGIKARIWEVAGHTTSEFWYNDAWHIVDSDIGLYYLTNDNKTVASIEQLWADHKLSGGRVENSHLTNFSFRNKEIKFINTDVEGNNLRVAQDGKRPRGTRYFHGQDYCYVQQEYDDFIYKPYNMGMVLRPNEKLVRNWKGGPVFYDYKRHVANYEKDHQSWKKIVRWGDGQIVWTPDLSAKDARAWLNREVYTRFESEDGEKPAIHVKHKRDLVYSFPCAAGFAVRTPYTIIGGRLKAKVYRGGATKNDGLAILLNTHPLGKGQKVLWQAPEGETGSMDVDVDMDETLYPGGDEGRHNYEVIFNFSAGADNYPPTQSGIDSVEMTTDIQCAPNSLPALSLGKNVIHYRDDTPGPHKVKITHIWRERFDNHPPCPPGAAVYPENSKKTKDLAPLFRWKESEDKDSTDSIANYLINISFDPQCRWPVATALLRETESGLPQWQLAEGWLNPDTTYYWQVKAQDSRRIWGEWSPVFNFRTD